MSKKKKKRILTIALLLCVALLLWLELGDSSSEPADSPLTLVEEPINAEPLWEEEEAPSPPAAPPAPEAPPTEEALPEESAPTLDEHGSYDSKEDVALYLHLYGRLPDNYISKKEAEELGWEGGSVEDYAPGKCIGGSRFGNYEGLLPEAEGRRYFECDIDTLGASSRGARRIVYSNDGLIYYTHDHYESFELLYGVEE